MNWIWFTILLVLSAITAIAAINHLTFPRLNYTYNKGNAMEPGEPLVSLLVPARDEGEVIAATLSTLLSQQYPNYEVLLLDDHSQDDTLIQVQNIADREPRLRVLRGADLPTGWLGKNWACQQLAREAQGEVLVFCDADVQWKPGALSHIVAGMQHFQADMLTVWPTQKTLSWAERLVVPLMNFVLLAYLPELCVRFIPWTIFAAANGQCLVFKRSSYQLIGGHQQVRKEIVEDVALARECKRKGQKLVMLLGDGLIGCRMYRNWDEVRQGFAKNILAGHLNSPAFLLASAIFHWSLFILPWLWLFTGWAVDLGSGWPWFPLVLISLGLGCRALTARTAGNKMRDAILMPVSVCLLTVIAGQSLWWNYRHGGPRWKGRQIQQER